MHLFFILFHLETLKCSIVPRVLDGHSFALDIPRYYWLNKLNTRGEKTMDKVLMIVKDVAANAPLWLNALGIILASLIGLCGALSAFFLLVPGSAPEKQIDAVGEALKKVAAFLSKFSAK